MTGNQKAFARFGFKKWARRVFPERPSHAPLMSLPPEWRAPPDPDDSGNKLTELVDQIELAALAIYAANGLPTRIGHYTWSPGSRRWRYLGEYLSSAERWEMVLLNSAEDGWRFGGLEDMGTSASDAPPDLSEAAALLIECRDIRTLLSQGSRSSPDDIERAIRLGAEWSRLESRVATTTKQRLKFTRADPKGGTRSA